jgi:hypothetical protein
MRPARMQQDQGARHCRTPAGRDLCPQLCAQALRRGVGPLRASGSTSRHALCPAGRKLRTVSRAAGSRSRSRWYACNGRGTVRPVLPS